MEADKAPGNTSVSIMTDVEMGEADNEGPIGDNHPAISEVQPVADLLEPLNQQQESEALSSSDAGNVSLEDIMAGIIVPLSRNSGEMETSDESFADFTFLKAWLLGSRMCKSAIAGAGRNSKHSNKPWSWPNKS